MRIGLICTNDPRQRDGLSGTPYAVRRSLLSEGASVRAFVPSRPTGGRVDGAGTGSQPEPLHRPRSTLRRAVGNARALAQRTPPGRAVARRRMLARVRREAAPLHEQVGDACRRGEVDVLLGCFSSGLLYKLDVNRPVVHFSDLTFRLLQETYAWARAMPPCRREGTEAVERDVLSRSDAVVVPTQWVRGSVVQDYGVPADRVHVVPLGANLCDGDAVDDDAGPELPVPSRADLRLTITAANPHRKRLDLAVSAVEALRGRGWNATLSCVGGSTPGAEAAPFVTCVGRLDHGDPQDRRRHARLIRGSHVMILPSEAEAFGIAPVEAAHLGRPSVVSAVGGLREVVLDGHTGRVVPTDASPDRYADAIEQLVETPQVYHRYCTAARDRARTTLNWTHFSRTLLGVMEELCRRGS